MKSYTITSMFFAGLFVLASTASAKFLPDNTLHLEDEAESNGMTEELFNEIIKKAEDYYRPVVKELGGKLSIKRLWSNDTVNASATRTFGTWTVNMYGGLARRPEITPDGFAMVLCHELGHHLGGFPYSRSWAANEGQSDYFTSLSCTRNLWENETQINAQAAKKVGPVAKELCDDSWASTSDQNLCYRVMNGAKSLANLLARGEKVALNTPDKKVVSKTNRSHPKGQCRLDTYAQGALCDNEWDIERIPKDESSSAKVSCTRSNGFGVGVRPLCWFKPGK